VNVTVEVEEDVAPSADSRNGSGPLWNAGSPMMVRSGDRVFVTTQEVGGPADNNICNTRWQLWGRDSRGWKLLQSPAEFREREPCPLGRFDDGRLLLSVNPSIQRPAGATQWMGRPIGASQSCMPHLLQFDQSDLGRSPSALIPVWAVPATLKDHTYRGIGVDAKAGELFVFNKSRDEVNYVWSFLDSTGRWSNQGQYKTEINSCYPLLALRHRAAHIVTVGDIGEPVQEWRKYKEEKQGKDAFFFVFRRIFYSWNPDIGAQEFAAPIEVDSVEQTAGEMWNLDLWLDAKGRAHLLYSKSNTTSLMIEGFFHDMPLQRSLEYCIIDKGSVVQRTTLYRSTKGDGSPWLGWARFHATPDGRLFVIAHVHDESPDHRIFENWIAPVMPDGQLGKHTVIPLKSPYSRFFTATERGGSPASYTLDLYGAGGDRKVLRYARVRLAPQR
jgi:hypothetical protein